MSKIYEALQRAELDRAIVANQPPPPAPPPTGAAPLPPLFPSLAAPRPAVPPVDPYASFDPRAFDFDAIRPVVWKPMLRALPSLQERGHSVEQFRSLRSRLFEFRDLNTLKSILVSSGLPQEGKSYVAANLAISFAHHKAGRVLLIDGDMRRSSLHTLLGCPKTPGLSSYLAGKATLMEVMQRAAPDESGAPLHPSLHSIAFIGGGDDGDLAADLSGSPRFAELIAAAAPHFDWIVVDSSPVNLVADGVNLSHACDGVLFVARGGVTKFESARRALQELKSTKVLGVVLNGLKKSTIASYSYSYDSYDTYDSKKE